MPRQDGRHRLDRFERAGFELARLERALHRAANGIPFCLLHPRSDAAVGDDFDTSIDELYIDEHAAPFFGVPYAELAEDLPRALARRQAQVREVQRAFEREADFTGMLLLRGFHCAFD